MSTRSKARGVEPGVGMACGAVGVQWACRACAWWGGAGCTARRVGLRGGAAGCGARWGCGWVVCSGGGDGLQLLGHGLDRLGAVEGALHRVAVRLEHVAHHPRVELVVLHHQHMQRLGLAPRLHLRGRGRPRRGRRGLRLALARRVKRHARGVGRGRQVVDGGHARRLLERDGGLEARAAPVLRLALDLASHELDELLRDREAHPRAPPLAREVALPPCGLVAGRQLAEEREERGLVLRLDPDARVLDAEAQVHGRVVLVDELRGHLDAAALGELQPVLEQVRQDLLQPVPVAHDHRRQRGALG